MLLLLALIAAAPAASGRAAVQRDRPAPEALAARLQQKYDAVRDFSASFVHTYRGGVLRTTATERGTVLIKKPGKMRWVYSHPEEKIFVSDGRRLYSYIPADRQVIVGVVPADDRAPTPALFLAGKGDLLRDFTVSAATPPDAPPDTLALALTPRRAEPDYDALTLVVDRQSLQIRQLVARDAQGGTSAFTFTDLKENIGLADTIFAFTIPRGVDVITSSHEPPDRIR